MMRKWISIFLLMLSLSICLTGCSELGSGLLKEFEDNKDGIKSELEELKEGIRMSSMTGLDQSANIPLQKIGI